MAFPDQPGPEVDRKKKQFRVKAHVEGCVCTLDVCPICGKEVDNGKRT